MYNEIIKLFHTPYDELRIWDKDLCKMALYFIHNLKGDHSLPGKDFYKIIGICDWAREHQYLTDKQKYYLYITLIDNINQIDYIEEYL
jgi:hypothetical protein